MLNFRKYAVLIAVFSSILAWAIESDVERFTHLKNEGIYDPSVSNQTINGILREGIESADPQINRLTLQAIGQLADLIVSDLRGPFETRVERSIRDVPRLKSYLIEHWKVGYARSGYSTRAQTDSDLASVDRPLLIEASQTNSGISESDLAALRS